MVATWHLDLPGHFPDRFFDGPAEIAAAHAVLDGDVALIRLAIDFGGAIALFDFAELRERDALAGGRQQANFLNGFPGAAVRGEVTKNEVVALLALEDLGEGRTADGGLNGVLNVSDIDLVA